jgi:hypothetical protein
MRYKYLKSFVFPMIETALVAPQQTPARLQFTGLEGKMSALSKYPDTTPGKRGVDVRTRYAE